MIIKQYEVYKLEIDKFPIFIHKSDALFYLRQLFLWYFGRIRNNFVEIIKQIDLGSLDRFEFEDIAISVDKKNNIIYVTEGWELYYNKPMTPEIEDLYDRDEYIQLCKIGFFDYMTIDKDNFFQLLLSWDKILDDKPCFVVLYQDENNWYDVTPFSTEAKMQQFVNDHLQK